MDKPNKTPEEVHATATKAIEEIHKLLASVQKGACERETLEPGLRRLERHILGIDPHFED
jgi:hypothetical protein